MIVPNMGEIEIIKEVMDDYLNVARYANYRDKEFTRMVIKSVKFPIYMNVEYLSPQKNKWLILYRSKSKKYKDNSSKFITVAVFESEIGKYAVMPTLTADKYLIFLFFTPHFFSRYAQRMGVDKTGLELMKHYFRHNHGYANLPHKTGISGTTDEGMALGIYTKNGNFLYRTFISSNILKGEQIDDYIEMNNLRKEIHPDTTEERNLIEKAT